MQETETPFWLQPSDAVSDLQTLYFVHGNSFPTGTYSEFLQALRADYQIRATEMLGHNPDFPVTDGWPLLCQELISNIESTHAAPVILVGHSLGGILSLMAARLRPDLVRCVVMLDSPLVVGWRALLLKICKLSRLDLLLSPAKSSRKRRKSWPDKEAAFQHFAGKDAFSIWPEKVLRDYITFGTEPYPKGVTLRFKREIETAIYRALPDNINRFASLPFPRPIGYICGTTSVESRHAGVIHTRQFTGPNFEWMEGGHLYPLESPRLTAQKVHAMIQKLLLADTKNGAC